MFKLHPPGDDFLSLLVSVLIACIQDFLDIRDLYL